MKQFFPLASLTLFLLLGACGDKQEQQAANLERHLRSANTFVQQGQFRAAMIEAKNAIQLQPQDAAGYIALANIYNRMGAYSATQTLLENILTTHPDASTPLAEAYMGSQKYRSALQVLSAHPATEPGVKTQQLLLRAKAQISVGDNSAFHDTLGELSKYPDADLQIQLLKARWALANGDSEAAAETLEKILVDEPENFEALILQGEIALYQNNLPVAEKYLTRALTTLGTTDIMTAQRIMVLNQLTDVLIREGRTSEAYAYQKLLSDANPESHGAQQRFNDALAFYQDGKYTEAEAVLTKLHEEFPDNSTTGTLLGLVQHQLGQDESAAELFDQHIDPETASTGLIQAAVITKLRADQGDEALALLKMAAENQPHNAAIMASYGLALLDRDEKAKEGALVLEKSLALDETQQRLRIALAKHYFALGAREQALAQLQKAYSEAPLDMIIQQSYFQALISEGKHPEVKRAIEEFQKQYPDNPRGSFLEGWLKLEEKDYEGARRALEQAITHQDNNEKQFSYAGLAQIYTIQKQPQKAIEAWQAALTADPGMTQAYGHWLALVHQQNRASEAVAFLSNLEKSSNSWQPSVMLARILVLQNNIKQAIAHMETALARSGDSIPVKQIAARLYHQQGISLLTQNKSDEAKHYLLRALKLFPKNINYAATLIQNELNHNNIEEAKKLLDQINPGENNQAAHLNLQALISVAEGKRENALQLYLQSWKIQPNDKAAEAIFTVYQKAEPQKANVFIDEWLQKLPKSAKPRLIQAMAAQQKSDLPAAIKWYEETLQLAPEMPAALNNLAWIYYQQKDPRALDLAKQAYTLAPNNPAILDTYGWLLVENGNVQQGHAILEQAAAKAPKNDEIQQHLLSAKSRLQ